MLNTYTKGLLGLDPNFSEKNNANSTTLVVGKCLALGKGKATALRNFLPSAARKRLSQAELKAVREAF